MILANPSITRRPAPATQVAIPRVQTRKAIYKMVFSDDIDKYDEESLRTVLVFAGNFIDITGYLKPGEVIPESVYLEANKKFFRHFCKKKINSGKIFLLREASKQMAQRAAKL